MITSPVKLWRRNKDTAALIGQIGKIIHWTIIRVPAKSFVDQAPYPVVIVKMESNKMMVGQLVDWQKENLRPGQKVEAVLRRLKTEDKESAIYYHIKFKPI